uniref:G-protein coupled receptors family 1 profile domain-containing protein n=1 Tax=Anser cygnoides TaxID=8845 RepID=A0A8B9DVY8_ANSCY
MFFFSPTPLFFPPAPAASTSLPPRSPGDKLRSPQCLSPALCCPFAAPDNSCPRPYASLSHSQWEPCSPPRPTHPQGPAHPPAPCSDRSQDRIPPPPGLLPWSRTTRPRLLHHPRQHPMEKMRARSMSPIWPWTASRCSSASAGWWATGPSSGFLAAASAGTPSPSTSSTWPSLTSPSSSSCSPPRSSTSWTTSPAAPSLSSCTSGRSSCPCCSPTTWACTSSQPSASRAFLCLSHQHEQCRLALISMYALNFAVFAPSMVISSTLLFIKVQCGSQRRQPRRLYIVIFLTVLFFLLFALPLSIWNFLQHVSYMLGQSQVVFLLGCINSSINPFIYFLVGSCRRRCSLVSLQVAFRRVFEELADNTVCSDNATMDTLSPAC